MSKREAKQLLKGKREDEPNVVPGSTRSGKRIREVSVEPDTTVYSPVSTHQIFERNSPEEPPTEVTSEVSQSSETEYETGDELDFSSIFENSFP